MADATQVPLDLASALAARYSIERELGRGGMATVYLAEDRKHHRKVAVKALRRDLALQLGAERFLREIGIAALLTHPHILPLIDSGEAAGLLYYVMPYVSGESLRQRLMREQRLSLRDALRMARDVGAALDYAHRQGFVHRDIKPENILLADGHAMVADFGIARAVSAAGVDPVTETGLALGTPAYMSPEQASAERELDVRSDLYSLACVLFEMLAGEPPFAGPNARSIMARQLTEHPRPVRSLRPDTPPAVEQAIARALAKDPEDRYPSVAAFLEALEAGQGPRPETTLVGTTRSLAVLPFVNMSPDPETDYFSDGITEELINAFTKVGGLRVASRTSVFALKNKPQDVRAIGALLGVSAVLEGSVRKAGDQLRITARLTAADDGRHLWSDRYDRRLDDVFAIQDEIARTIVTTLRTTFLAEVADPTPRRYTENVAAYGLYLRGRYSWNKRSDEGVRESIDYFEQAIAADPNYALGLLRPWPTPIGLQVDYRGVPVAEGLNRAREYARRPWRSTTPWPRPTRRSPGSCSSTIGIGTAPCAPSGGRVELNPGYATGRQWYSFVLCGARPARPGPGRRARRPGPRSGLACRFAAPSAGCTTTRGATTPRSGSPAASHRHEPDLPGNLPAPRPRPDSTRGLRPGGARLARSDRHASGKVRTRPAALGYLLAVRGNRQEAKTIVAQLEVRSQSEYVSPVASRWFIWASGTATQAFSVARAGVRASSGLARVLEGRADARSAALGSDGSGSSCGG